MVVTDSRDFIAFALVTDGTNLGMRVQSVSDAAATTVFHITSFNEYRDPMYLRITRSGAAYIAYYSVDGVVWSQAATFSDARVPTSIGAFPLTTTEIQRERFPSRWPSTGSMSCDDFC